MSFINRKLRHGRWRTTFRAVLPTPVYRFLYSRNLIRKQKDCEAVSGHHEWYNEDNVVSGCFHCEVEREGQLWRELPEYPMEAPDRATPKPAQKHAVPQTNSKDIGCWGNLFLLVFFFGGLWLLVAVVKWMWEHS